MPIKGSKKLGDWGKMVPANESGSQHITQTNKKSRDGEGAHVTTQVKGGSVRDRFDKHGNHKGSDAGK